MVVQHDCDTDAEKILGKNYAGGNTGVGRVGSADYASGGFGGSGGPKTDCSTSKKRFRASRAVIRALYALVKTILDNKK